MTTLTFRQILFTGKLLRRFCLLIERSSRSCYKQHANEYLLHND